MATMRDIAFGFNVSVTIDGNIFKTKSGSVKVAVELADVSGTDASGPTGTGREKAYGLDEAELSLVLFADRGNKPYLTPLIILPRTDIQLVQIYYWGVAFDPISLRNVRCDSPIDWGWDTPAPNMINLHGWSNDYTIPST